MLRRALQKIKPLYKALRYIKRRIKGIDESSQRITRDELHFLLEVAGKGRDIIEIGSSIGQTTKRLAIYNQVIAIDPFIPGKDGLLMGEYLKDFHNAFLTNIKGRSVIFYNMTSERAFNIWDKKIKRKVDGIFIDGEHTYNAVKQDVKWIKYIKKGGFIAFHDVNYQDGIRNFVEEFIVPNYEFIGKRDSLWIFRKTLFLKTKTKDNKNRKTEH